jgi:hypothetical protein
VPAIPLGVRDRDRRPGPIGPAVGWAAVLVALVLAASPLASGYFDFSVWGPLALGAIVILVVVARVARPRLGRRALLAGSGLGILISLSAASLLWAVSKESAWTAVNRLAFYGVLFAIVLLAVRDRRTGRIVMLILGSAALATSLWLCVSLLLGGSQGAFLTRRLNAPIGYINGTAGLLVMGIWPWLAYAETAPRRVLRAAALAGAALIAGPLVLTQSRAVIPAMALSAALVLLCAPERTRRAVNLMIAGASVALALPWTLAVYSTGGVMARSLSPGHGLLRSAAAAMLLTALGAGLVHFALSGLAARVAPQRRQRAQQLLGRALVVASIASIGVGSVLGAPWVSRQYRSFTALHVNQDASVRFIDASGFRYDLWRVAVREFRSRPFGGLGAGNYDVEYYRLRNNPEYVLVPHSLELQMAAELGIGGVLALLLFCGAIVSSGFARRGTLASEDRMIRLAALGMFVAWLVDTSVDWLYDIPGLTGMAIVAAALLVAPGAHGGGRRIMGRGRQAAFVLGLGILALLAASVGRQYAASRYAQAGASQAVHSPQRAIGTLRQAAQLDPYSLSTLYSLSAAYARLNDYPRARAALLLATRREPHNYVPPALLGDLAMRRGDYRRATAEYRSALALNPLDPVLRQAELGAQAAAR